MEQYKLSSIMTLAPAAVNLSQILATSHYPSQPAGQDWFLEIRIRNTSKIVLGNLVVFKFLDLFQSQLKKAWAS